MRRMSLACVVRQRLACSQPVASGVPVRGGNRCRFDAQRFDGVDHFEHCLDLLLAIGAQQDARACARRVAPLT